MNPSRNIRPIFIFLLSVFILISAFTIKSYGQFAEITGLGGYTLAETFGTDDGFEVYLKDGGTYGASLAYYPNEYFDIAITYTRQETKVNVYDYIFGGYSDDISASVNNIMIGGNRNQPVGAGGKSYLFGGLNLGTAGLEPKESQYSGVWKFAFDVHVGAKIFPSSKVGIRLQTGLNFPVQYFGAAFTVGTGGSGAGVSAGSTITQLYFLGGLIIRLTNE